MSQNTIFGVIAVAVIIMGLVLFAFVFQGAKVSQELVLKQQEDATLESDVLIQSIFSVGDPAFESFEHACFVPFIESVFFNVNFRYRETPDSCSFFADGKYRTTVKDLEPDCITECPYGEFSRTYSLRDMDVRESHVIRVCCDDICIEKKLAPLCTGVGQQA